MAIIGYLVVGYFALRVVASIIGVAIITAALAGSELQERD